MGQPARNHGGTRGLGYRGNTRGKPDSDMFRAATKSFERVGFGIEVVSRREFEKRKQVVQVSGHPGSTGGLSDKKGITNTDRLFY